MSALEDIANERQRQIDKESWSVECDDDYIGNQLANAAACYAAPAPIYKRSEYIGRRGNPSAHYSDLWPWEEHWWKPTDRRRDLVKAGALIVAEIERLDRAKKGEAR